MQLESSDESLACWVGLQSTPSSVVRATVEGRELRIALPANAHYTAYRYEVQVEGEGLDCPTGKDCADEFGAAVVTVDVVRYDGLPRDVEFMAADLDGNLIRVFHDFRNDA